jgi:uncharacterized protein YhbP (UPF0306 family)
VSDVSESVRRQVERYLADHNVMTLATAGPRGPWAAAVFYASDGLLLHFVSAPGSRHGEDLARSPRAAAAVHEDYRAWEDVKGVQLEGTVTEVGPAELPRVRALYAGKFPMAGGPDTPPVLAAALAKVRWYVLSPDAVFFVDNAAGFGHRTRVENFRL